MHTESAYDGCTAYCYPKQGMVDRLLRVHIQSLRAFGPRLTLSYTVRPHGFDLEFCVHWSGPKAGLLRE